ncbi:MAG: oxygen-independent coproporphyrinogen III oxidase [Deltaproteobacteria bacterium]|nr:oxygen-independent coproporphyrinogen III oxidase [Deltaproteobacteria bacterium]
MSPKNEVLEIRCGDESIRFSPQLLDKYNVAGPRYTSYPTAPEWRKDFGPAEMRAALEQSNREARPRPLSLYMHLPFCEHLCLYCGCNTVISRDHAVAIPYLADLEREIERFAERLDPARAVEQFHWGGGTPTYLSPQQMEDLFGAARRRFRFAPNAEIGVEVDPRVTTAEHVSRLRRLGFNRLSLGVQDFDPLVQQTVHRIQPFEATSELFRQSRAEGFESINVDLIYGLPHQTVDSFTRTLGRVIEMNPDRIAMYSYAHVPWLKKQQAAFARFIPEGRAKFELFAAGLRQLTAAGYRFIGFDHFARPTDELCVAQEERTLARNFQGYTTHSGCDLLGLGVSAISGIGRVYAQNFRDLPSYARRIGGGDLATMRGIRLTEDDVLRREVIVRVLCHGRLRTQEIESEFGIDFEDYFAAERSRIEDLERDGLIELRAGEISVTLLGRIFLRVVGMVFDAYLQRGEGDRPVFSKTV